MPLFFDDFTVGQEFTTPARTVTETDVVTFAGLTGDYNPIHTDAEFARSTRFGERLAHGVLGLSICTGLIARLGIFDGSAIALLGIEEWKFHSPVFIGDTVRCRLTIARTHLVSRGDAGVVSRRIELLNQRDDVTQSGILPILVARHRPAGQI